SDRLLLGVVLAPGSFTRAEDGRRSDEEKNAADCRPPHHRREVDVPATTVTGMSFVVPNPPSCATISSPYSPASPNAPLPVDFPSGGSGAGVHFVANGEPSLGSGNTRSCSGVNVTSPLPR